MVKAIRDREYFVDVEWFRRNKRSLEVLIERRICPSCRSKPKRKPSDVAALIDVIRTCCSSSSDFMNARLPILEVIFRLLLANGNQPLALETLTLQLNENRKGVLPPVSTDTLQRLLDRDKSYGITPYNSSPTNQRFPP